ncbi:MAG TPA: DUF5063 domain-containing protein [Bacteroidales bacterium]|nr:DUF5063 domain-containing protein [Bacteroidales bacterium]HCI54955.1 DUF5063 domain-containing protein [Bacteroidales bacterium]HOU96123.1 DUF5063 domain-containing protein [Bacteroidales bacterium]HQG37195.1 DUF5063 domain-containing protein [Bacteroidales bacterium]HQJ19721.1 DUF5063 domain-containing protein [Bacteroidales bacterium]
MKRKPDSLFSGTIVEFVASANEFCKYAEHASEIEAVNMLKILQRLLPFIYLKASLLPDLEPYFEEGNEKFVKESDWNRIHDVFLSKLGTADAFLEVFDERMKESEVPITASLAENLADIYQDLKDFVILYQTGTNEIMNDAIWECKMNFENYWGQKLVNSLRAIHKLIYSGEEIGKQPEDITDEKSEMQREKWFISRRQKDFRKNVGK